MVLAYYWHFFLIVVFVNIILSYGEYDISFSLRCFEGTKVSF